MLSGEVARKDIFLLDLGFLSAPQFSSINRYFSNLPEITGVRYSVLLSLWLCGFMSCCTVAKLMSALLLGIREDLSLKLSREQTRHLFTNNL